MIIISILQGIALGVIAVLLFELIVFIHEFGHFICAKKSGVQVNEFALGMGPKIIKFQKGETLYSLRLLPIGGFCSMEGEDEDSDNPRAFGKAKVWKRIIIVAAGAIMNIILGFVMMLIIQVQEPYYASTTIAQFSENSYTEKGGLQIGDEIISFGGYKINTINDLSFAMALVEEPFNPEIIVKRNGEKVNLGNIQMDCNIIENGKKTLKYDFYVQAVDKNFKTVITETATTTVSTIKMVWYSLVGLVTGKFGFNEISGPVGMTSAISEVASAGLESSFLDGLNNILMIMMIITVNLGIFNLLPIPALDGGRLVFLIIEAIRRKPINPKYEGYVHAGGFAVLMLFMIVVTFSDIIRLFTGSGLGG